MRLFVACQILLLAVSNPTFGQIHPIRSGGSAVDSALCKDEDESDDEYPNAPEFLLKRGKVFLEREELDDAISDFSAVIRLDPKYDSAFAFRGFCWIQKREFKKAIADLNEAIRLNPESSRSIEWRGAAWFLQGELDKAISDYSEAIRLNPAVPGSYRGRASLFAKIGQYEKALADFTNVINLSAVAMDLNDYAWFLATCPDDKIRDGKRAVKYATFACEGDGSEKPEYLDTLAASYAEAGDFINAVKWQTAAMDFAPAKEKGDYRSRLDLYKNGKPFREKSAK